ncbi:DAK2 domain-containing protein [Clostridium estertheticum]|uniref:DAK2 domain-containing protein n=1 Tax=Clostridium estertheticum TaxID=238834 RepID=UPI001C7DFEF3|nr:DAK2 domain-containing protein [Clostridium estertheticum]MBX4265312.1 DAK2 domain-containing protein [Clostridium estertheticum]MBX4269349.1 DAK2 domain-containing protein [Clostridium estertheticum]WLC79304.1 DAK2 domain-containing protein [Clostridium estertheticum]WLC90328.1 DAK2 domain-containing protein [Clostridium estertheticum]
MEYLKINGRHFRNMVINASNRLEDEKEYVNSLNVFPVPDGDTGTNMSMTFKAAVQEIENIQTESIAEIAKILARGALMGARGNSGVILSQIFRGIAKGLEGITEATSEEFAKSILEGSKFAYKAVMRPTEGTILTIIKTAGESAVNSETSDIVELMNEVCKQSEIMLNKTPDMLAALREAKVVDAGGMGLLILFKGMKEAISNNIEAEIYNTNKQSNKKETIVSSAVEVPIEIKFGYCTELLIIAKDIDTNKLKEYLEKIGDSMVVVSQDEFLKIHIHTNDPGLVLSKAVTLGELSKVKIENMREQHRNLLGIADEKVEKFLEKDITKANVIESKKYGFISVALGEGIKNIFEDLGVDVVIEGGQTMNPSIQDIIDSISKINAENIFVLPNNKNILMAALQAAELSDKNIVVIPSITIPQGITAVTMFNPDVSVEENEEKLKEVIKNVATASVTYAVKDTEFDGKIIKQGNILGLVEQKICEVGTDMYKVCADIIGSMVNDNSELITIFYGEDCVLTEVEKLISNLEHKYPNLDIQQYNGKQPLYYFIASVE